MNDLPCTHNGLYHDFFLCYVLYCLIRFKFNLDKVCNLNIIYISYHVYLGTTIYIVRSMYDP